MDDHHRKIVFVVCSGREAALAHPIFDELKRRGIDKSFLAISTGEISKEKFEQGPEEAMTALGMPFKRLQDYRTKDITKILRQEQAGIVLLTDDQEFIRRSFVLASNGLNIPILALEYQGISGHPRTNMLRSLKGSLYRLTHNFSNIVLRYMYLLRTLIALGWGPFKMLGMIGKDLWIAVSVYEAGRTFGYQTIAATSSQHKQALIERGVEVDRIFLTGNPVYDALPQENVHTSQAVNLRRSLNIGQDDRIILLLTSAQAEHGVWTCGMRENFVTGVVNSLAPILDEPLHLIIKLHPLENLGEYQIMLAPSAQAVILLKDVKLSTIISLADVVIAGYSTTVLDACILHKPVVLLNIFDEPHYIPYVEMGIATGVYHLSKLKATVQELLYNQSAREKALNRADVFLNENRQLMDGKAASRIVDLLIEISQKHRVN